MANSKYLDVRQQFWEDTFRSALPYENYLAQSEQNHAAKWRDMEGSFSLTEAQTQLVKSFERRMNVLVYSGVWCGDCVRQGPMFQSVAALSDNIDLRFAERVDGSPLSDELRINGALKVPVVVFLSEDFFECGRFGDRLLTVYRRMAQRQLGASCETGLVVPPEEQLNAELSEWVDVWERMHIILRLAPMLRERYGD
ncbi:MAG: thioredoxin family protein [Candidatus Sumerlaeota bacterium]